jgi:predicted dehydrogenase
MPKDRVRIAFIGAGSMANTVHYPSLASFDDVELAAICDLDPARLNATADKYGVTGRYADYRQMIEEVAPDGVYAIGQPHLLYDLWVWLLQNKQNLYIEKPMGLTLHQAQMLEYLAAEAGVITQVSFQRRVCPLLVELRRRIAERGPITHAAVEFFKCEPRPMFGARDRMMDDTVHSIDTVRWMVGGEVVGLESQCRRIGTPDINWIAATLHFDGGGTGFLVNSWTSGRRVFRVQMHGLGMACDAEVEGLGHLYADGDYGGECFDTKVVAGGEELYVFGGFRAKNREFIDSLKTGVEVTSSPFRDAVKTMAVAERILVGDLLA